MATDPLARGNHDNQKGEEAMKKHDPFVLDTPEVSLVEVSLVKEAIEARVSLLQTLPPSLWRDSRLRFLNSFIKKLDQLMDQAQLEHAMLVGRD
jgi:hypothetical protein